MAIGFGLSISKPYILVETVYPNVYIHSAYCDQKMEHRHSEMLKQIRMNVMKVEWDTTTGPNSKIAPTIYCW